MRIKRLNKLVQNCLCLLLHSYFKHMCFIFAQELRKIMKSICLTSPSSKFIEHCNYGNCWSILLLFRGREDGGVFWVTTRWHCGKSFCFHHHDFFFAIPFASVVVRCATIILSCRPTVSSLSENSIQVDILGVCKDKSISMFFILGKRKVEISYTMSMEKFWLIPNLI